jgi:hypothetical protein
MGKPLMIQEHDDKKINELKEKTGMKTKIDVVRSALNLLEAEVDRIERVKRWGLAVKTIGNSSREVREDFKKFSCLKK